MSTHDLRVAVMNIHRRMREYQELCVLLPVCTTDEEIRAKETFIRELQPDTSGVTASKET